MRRKLMMHTLAMITFMFLGSAIPALAAGNYTVRGRLFYYDGRSQGVRPVNQYNGTANVKFQIYDRDNNSGDDLLATGVVGWDGRFEASFHFSQSSENYADMYIKFTCRNSKWKVVNSGGGDYVLNSWTLDNRGYGTVDFGNMYVPRNGNHEKAMWVFQSMNEGWNYVEATNDWNVGDQVRVQWPGKSSCPTSCANSGGIHITESRAGNTKNVIHEYGHIVNFRAWDRTGPGSDYCRTEGSGASSCGHSWNSLEYSYPSFKEGWANFVAYAALGCVGNNNCRDIEDRNYNTMNSGNEGNVTAALGDILENRYDAHAQGGFNGQDTISWTFYGMTWVLGHMSGSEIGDRPSIRDYVDEIREVYSSPSYTSWRQLMNNNWVSY